MDMLYQKTDDYIFIITFLYKSATSTEIYQEISQEWGT